MPYPKILFAIFCFILSTNSSTAQDIDCSWVWCEPSNSITYFIKPSAANWAKEINQAAKDWSDASPWEIKASPQAKDARILISVEPINTFMEVLVQKTHHRGHFKIIKRGYIEISGLQKPCVEQAEIKYFTSPNNPPLSTLSLALHEFGHALNLDDTDDPTDVMYGVENKGTKLSQSEIDSAIVSSGKSNLNQLHQSLLPDGGVLAFSDVRVDIPAGAFADSVVFGIRPLSPASIPLTSTSKDQIIAAAQIGPEWTLEEEVAGVYQQKQVPFKSPIIATFRVPKDGEGGLRSSAEFDRVNANRPAIDPKSLAIAYIDLEGSPIPMESSLKDQEEFLEVSASLEQFGNYVLSAEELSPLEPTPPKENFSVVYYLLLVGLIIVIGGLLFRRR